MSGELGVTLAAASPGRTVVAGRATLRDNRRPLAMVDTQAETGEGGSDALVGALVVLVLSRRPSGLARPPSGGGGCAAPQSHAAAHYVYQGHHPPHGAGASGAGPRAD